MSFTPTPHPVLLLPPPEALASLPRAELAAFYTAREEKIALEESDPFAHGYEPPMWAEVDKWIADVRHTNPHGIPMVLIMGGMRSSKTQYCAKRAHQVSLAHDATRTIKSLPADWPAWIKLKAKAPRVWIFGDTEESSIGVQQDRMWELFPLQYKPSDLKGRIKQGAVTSIAYNKKTGFAGNSYTLPNKATVEFKYYTMQLSALQGYEIDFAWLDELAPEPFIKTCQQRLITRTGVLMASFVPIHGRTPTVARFLNGSTKIREIEAELLPVRNAAREIIGYEKVPVIIACHDPMERVFYFHTAMNPWGNFSTMKAVLSTAPRERILMDAYGEIEGMKGALFAYNPAVHEVEAAHLKEAMAKATWYLSGDPSYKRNFALQFWAVTATGQKILAREWPQQGDFIPVPAGNPVGDPGPWAVLGSKPDGERGQAQKPMRLSLEEMSDEINRVRAELGRELGLPGPVELFEQTLDSRFAGTATASAGEYTTLLEKFEELEDGRAQFFQPAPGGSRNAAGTDWITLINSALRVNPVSGAPEIVICSRCKNTILALTLWTNEDGEDGAVKDFVDCTKYFYLSDPIHALTEARESGRKSRKTPGAGKFRGYGG